MRMNFQQIPNIQPEGQALVVCLPPKTVLCYKPVSGAVLPKARKELAYAVISPTFDLLPLVALPMAWPDNLERRLEMRRRKQRQIYELDLLRVVKLTIRAQFLIQSVTGLTISAVKSQVEGPDKGRDMGRSVGLRTED